MIIGFQLVLAGLSYAQTSEVIKELAQERAEEKRPILDIEEEAKVNKQNKIEEEKALIEIKHKDEDKDSRVIQKPKSYRDEPRQDKKTDTLDKELKDWLDKLKAIESNLP